MLQGDLDQDLLEGGQGGLQQPQLPLLQALPGPAAQGPLPAFVPATLFAQGAVQLRGQVAGIDVGARGHDREPTGGVLQLADIAGPVQALELLGGAGAEDLGLATQLLGRLGEEVGHQDGYVLAALPQRRQVDTDDVEAVEQVLAEAPLADQFLQVLVGGGDDAHIDLGGGDPADPVEGPVGQDPQQPGLKLGGHVADLVEEQGAAVGLLEASLASRLGPGEGPALVAEQLGLQQVAGDGGHIQRNEGLVRPRAVSVQGAGDQFLAGAGLAVDQHRDVGAGQAPYGPVDLLHGRGLTDDVGSDGGGRGGRGLFLAAATGTTDLIHRLVQVEGLGQVLEGPTVKGGYRALQVRVGGHDDHRQGRVAGVDLTQQVQAVDAGHADVGEDDIGHVALQGLHDPHAVGEGGHVQFGLAQRLLQDPTDGAVVVDDPDLGCSRHVQAPVAGRPGSGSARGGSRIR